MLNLRSFIMLSFVLAILITTATASSGTEKTTPCKKCVNKYKDCVTRQEDHIGEKQAKKFCECDVRKDETCTTCEINGRIPPAMTTSASEWDVKIGSSVYCTCTSSVGGNLPWSSTRWGHSLGILQRNRHANMNHES
ncbi:hypothetical protein EJ07DRAFT_155516 [Lizonia empirigonia]|nr:hypothetical protein EJ07DRAFT_155516 [Lizonia empirigonia]